MNAYILMSYKHNNSTHLWPESSTEASPQQTDVSSLSRKKGKENDEILCWICEVETEAADSDDHPGPTSGFSAAASSSSADLKGEAAAAGFDHPGPTHRRNRRTSYFRVRRCRFFFFCRNKKALLSVAPYRPTTNMTGPGLFTD